MSFKISNKDQLEKFACCRYNEIHRYIDQAQESLPQPIYSSVDIRESQYKYAPVDHNMYPAGFNNICKKDLKVASTLFKEGMKKHKANVKIVGILPESHTKNKYYLDNIYFLQDTLKGAAEEVILISPDHNLFPEDTTELTLTTQSEFSVTIHKVLVKDGQFVFANSANQKTLDLIVLNHDQSTPFDIVWKDFKTPVVPSPMAGWYRRQKIQHFKHYHLVVLDFCKHFDVDPYLLEASFRYLEKVDFEAKEGIEELATEVDTLLKTLPTGSNVFVKASQGTYGMGISVFTSGDEARAMNRKTRNKMDIGKNNIKFTSVLIQEGVETIIKHDNAPAEVTVYLIDGKAAGGFMRFNPLKDSTSNLNSQGMLYRKFCISEVKQDEDHQVKEAIYSIVARLSVLAASKEMQELSQEKI